MKLSKLLLATMSATVLLGALVSSASARIFSISSQTYRATWARMEFSGGFGTIECEVVLRGSFHSRTFAKVTNSLLGYITEGRVNRCTGWGVTINTGSLPWHRRYRSFVGALPNITGIAETITGAEWTMREPVFGITCTVRREASSTIATHAITRGVLTRADVTGTSDCSGITVTLSGGTTAVDNGTGTRITLTLI
jgi:hypothetical protein